MPKRLFHSANPDSYLYRMLLHVLIERHGFIDHFLVNAAGIEQMQSVLVPGGDAYVGSVESLLIGDDGDDVAIFDGIAEELGIGYLPFWDIAITLATDTLLQLSDARSPLWMGCQHLIARYMRTHPVDIHFLHGSKGRIGGDVLHDALFLIVIHPYSEIVLALNV